MNLGKLTINPSQFYLKDNQINIGINLRIPVHTKIEDIINKFEENFPNKVTTLSTLESLYIDKNDKLVKTKIYEGFFIDKNSRKIDNSNVSYDGNFYRFGEVDNKFYYCIEDRSKKNKDCSSSMQKYIHLANKNNLLHEKITIGECTDPIWTDKILLESI